MTDVLILDDDEQITTLVQAMLTRAGYTVAVESSGNRALQAIGDHEFRLLITDILMPEIDGIDVIQQSRRRQPNLKIIAMSGGRRKITADFNLKSARMLGASESLEKPFTKDQLLKAVERQIGKP